MRPLVQRSVFMNKILVFSVVVLVLGGVLRFLNQNYDAISGAVADGASTVRQAREAQEDERLAPIFAGLTEPQQLFVNQRDPSERDVFGAAWPSVPGFLELGIGADDWETAAVQIITSDGAHHLWLTDLKAGRDGTYTGKIALKAARYGPKIGGSVTFDKFEVRDWAISREGTVFGLFTARHLLANYPPDVAQGMGRVLSTEPVPDGW